jgi:hypothetical protein
VQFLSLAVGLNDYCVRPDFNAADMNPSTRGQQVSFISDCERVVVDSD